MYPEEIVNIQSRYEAITLNFGKHKGKTLKAIISADGGPDYLIWLYGQMKTNETPTPTQKAIMKYISAVYDL